MIIDQTNQHDLELVLSHQHDLGGALWTTPDKRLIKGSPFSTLDSVMLLLELGMEPEDPLLLAAAELILSTWREDGRFKLYPTGAIYPCQTARAAEVLCHLGFGADPRVEKTLQHLLDTQYGDGGWRCNKFSFGRGPETEFSNPYPTLLALDAFRFSEAFRAAPALERSVEFLLRHWEIKKPIGPCQYGMGTRFMQVEFPFRSYNLFFYVYVLSFYEKAKQDARFLEALAALEEKAQNGEIIVERTAPKLRPLSMCSIGRPSRLATKRFLEIGRNVKEL